MPEESIKLHTSKFLSELYPFDSNKREFTILFQQMRLVKSENLRAYLAKTGYLTAEETNMLDYLLGDASSVESLMEHFDEDENDFLQIGGIYDTGKISLCVSSTGKEETRDDFYAMRYKYSTVAPIESTFNFIYFKDSKFQCIQGSQLVSQIKSTAFDKDTKKINSKVLHSIYNMLNLDDDGIEGINLIEDINLKSSQTTLSKVLISLFPHLEMKKIVELTDFLNTERISNLSNAGISKNIFELKGDLITYFYNVKNYQYKKEGTLGNSCMRHDSTTEQIRFYANNPTNVSLLAYIINKKLLARGVLWTDVNGDKVVDRIYHSSSKYGAELAAYCKSKGYKTVHPTTSREFGIDMPKACVVKIDSVELKNSNYPYLDSMGVLDVFNSYLSTTKDVLKTHLEDVGITNYFIIPIDSSSWRFSREALICKNNIAGFGYLRDDHNTSLSNLNSFVLATKPKAKLLNRNEKITINDNEHVDYEWCKKTLITKYNALRPTLVNVPSFLRNKERQVIRFYDKSQVVYSTYHKIYIRRKDSIFVSQIGTFVLKNCINSSVFKYHLMLSKRKKLYGGKLVRIQRDYLRQLKNSIKTLSFNEPLSDLRQSRVYNISSKNVQIDGILIKGIVVPFKYIRFVKK